MAKIPREHWKNGRDASAADGHRRAEAHRIMNIS
jgi:hypothetical protein